MDKGEQNDKTIEGRQYGEIHEADEEHKHHPPQLDSDIESDDDEGEEENEEGEGQEIMGSNYASLAKAIEEQSDYIRGLTEEIKVLRTELQKNITRPQARKSPNKNKNKKKVKSGGKRKTKR